MSKHERSVFEALTVGLLVAGLLLATLLMLAIAWRMRGHSGAARELASKLAAEQQQHATLVDLLGRYEARAQKLEADLAAEERRRAEQADLERQAAIARAQEEAKLRADEEARRRNTPPELMKQGEVLLRERRYQEAVQRYNAVLQLDPQHARALANRALALRALGQIDEALADLDRAVLLDPRDTYLLQTRAALLLERHRDTRAQDALADCERALSLLPPGSKQGFLRYHRGVALHALGRLEEARAEYRWVQDNAPELRRLASQVLQAIEAKARATAEGKPTGPDVPPPVAGGE